MDGARWARIAINSVQDLARGRFLSVALVCRWLWDETGVQALFKGVLQA